MLLLVKKSFKLNLSMAVYRRVDTGLHDFFTATSDVKTWTTGCVAGLDTLKIKSFSRISNPIRPLQSHSLYRLSYQNSKEVWCRYRSPVCRRLQYYRLSSTQFGSHQPTLGKNRGASDFRVYFTLKKEVADKPATFKIYPNLPTYQTTQP